MRCANRGGHGAARQKGFTLLLTMLVLLVGGASVYLAARDPAAARTARETQTTMVNLKQAIDALSVYSLDDENHPGSLPCPDHDGSGTVSLFSGSDCPDYSAFLPWKTLGLDSGVSGYLYIMDPDFRDHSVAEPINVDIEGSLVLNGVPDHAALVIDPGDPLEGQTGRGTEAESIEDYLDIEENTNGDDVFVDCADRDDCNDRVRGIKVDELFHGVQRRAMGVIEDALRTFHGNNGHLPYAAAFSGGDSCNDGVMVGRIATQEGDCGTGESLTTSDLDQWITDNEWLDHIVYVVDAECTESGIDCSAAALVLKDRDGLAVIMAGAGTPLAGQDRINPSSIDDYLDSAENTDGNDIFDDAPLAPDDNDTLLGFGPP